MISENTKTTTPRDFSKTNEKEVDESGVYAYDVHAEDDFYYDNGAGNHFTQESDVSVEHGESEGPGNTMIRIETITRKSSDIIVQEKSISALI